eukprot:jgi/Botrbrau1/7228/Bobra.0021s0013.1
MLTSCPHGTSYPHRTSYPHGTCILLWGMVCVSQAPLTYASDPACLVRLSQSRIVRVPDHEAATSCTYQDPHSMQNLNVNVTWSTYLMPQLHVQIN